MPDKLLVNAALLDSVAAAAHAADAVSPVFGVVLRPSEHAASVLLEAPDDVQQLEVYNRLQKLVVAKMKDAEDAMNKRIEAFVEQEREQLQLLTTRAYQDKKLFWLRYVAAIKGGGPQQQQQQQQPPPSSPALLGSHESALVSGGPASAVFGGDSKSAHASLASSDNDPRGSATTSTSSSLSPPFDFAVQQPPVTLAAPAAATTTATTTTTSTTTAMADPSPTVVEKAAAPAAVKKVRVARPPASGTGELRAVFDIDLGLSSQDVADVAESSSDEEEEEVVEEPAEASRMQRRRADANASTQSPKPRAVAGVAMSMPLAIPDFGGRRGRAATTKGGGRHDSDADDSPSIEDSLNREQQMARTFQQPIRDDFDRPSFRDRAEYRVRKFTK
jgi:hypothetical protein